MARKTATKSKDNSHLRNGKADDNSHLRNCKAPRKKAAAEATTDHLAEAVANPGVADIPEATIMAGPAPVLEIPSASLAPGAGEAGEPLTLDPALLTAAIDRPGPHTWVRLAPERTLRTVLLAHKPRDASADYYFVIPELQPALRDGLKQVQVHLLYDITPPGTPFLWIVPETEMSPYHTAMQTVLAKGAEFIRAHEFRFAYKRDTRRGTCEVRVRAVRPDAPLPTLPSRPVSQLLAEAMRQERIVASTDHPLYQALTAGGRL
jgi:hypothetical protein